MYLQSSLGNFGIFVFKVQPLLHCSTNIRVCVVHQLEACYIRLTLLKLCQVDVQKSLQESREHVSMTYCDFSYSSAHRRFP